MKKLILVATILFFSASSEVRAEEPEKKWPMILSASYLKLIKNSVGSRAYRNLYFKVNGKKVDVLENGNLSCAYFVSSVLFHFKLIGSLRTTVQGTVDDMKKSGWKSIKKPVRGSVIVWGKRYFKSSGQWHAHIGFYVGNGWAVSTNSEKRRPVIHPWRREYKSKKLRKVVKILWHPRLN